LKLQAGELVMFCPDPRLDDCYKHLDGMIGIITEFVIDKWGDGYVMVLWPDGIVTDTHLQDLKLLDHVRDRAPIV